MLEVVHCLIKNTFKDKGMRVKFIDQTRPDQTTNSFINSVVKNVCPINFGQTFFFVVVSRCFLKVIKDFKVLNDLKEKSEDYKAIRNELGINDKDKIRRRAPLLSSRA